MTQAVIKLVKGARTLDLMAAPYNAGADFAPPATEYATGLAGGGSANITGGATVYSRKYLNKSFSFQVKISSTSDGGVNEALRGLSAFLALAGDEDEPLYLHYKANSDTPEPLWGQYGANSRYEVVDARIAGLWDRYGETKLRAHTAFVTVEMTIKPFALGRLQRAAIATGGIVEDVIGTTDWHTRGIYLAEATQNYFFNSVFSRTGFNIYWTAGASIISASNTDRNYIFPGTIVSAHLTATASTENTYTSDVIVGTTCPVTISCYAKLEESGSIGASHLVLYYGATGSRTTTYTSVCNGWYRLTASNLSGSNAVCAVGVQVKKNKAVYVTGFQIEQKTYATPLTYGDQIGTTWVGGYNPHNAYTARAAAKLKIPLDRSVALAGQGSIRMVVKFDDVSGRSYNQILFDLRDASNTAAPYAYFNFSDTKFYLISNTSEQATSGAQTVSNQTFILHLTWGSAGTAVYVNGSAGTPNATYTVKRLGADLFIGTDYLGANPYAGTILGFATFNRVLTATEVANDYATIAPIVAREKQVDPIPYFWTLDGDNTLSLDTGKQPLGVVYGIPGDAPAITDIQGALSDNWNSIGSIFMSNLAVPINVPWNEIFEDQSGSAGADDYGGSHLSVSGIGYALSPCTTVGTGVTVTSRFGQYLSGQEFALIQREKFSASGIYTIWGGTSLDTTMISGVNSVGFGDSRSITTSASYRMHRSSPFIVSYAGNEFSSLRSSATYQYDILALNYISYATSTASTFSACVDYQALLARPYVILGAASSAGAYQGFSYRGNKAFVVQHTDLRPTKILIQTGDIIEFEPNKFNHLQVYFGALENLDPVTTYSCSINAIYLTPRWLLM